MVKAPQSRTPEPDKSAKLSTSNLAERIARAKKGSVAEEAAQTFRRGEMTGMGRAFRLASEFVAAIIVGALVGYGIDAALGTKPWAMIVLLLLGFAAGVLNVVRATSEMRTESSAPLVDPAEDDDED
jgi:ATP synthase protein I